MCSAFGIAGLRTARLYIGKRSKIADTVDRGWPEARSRSRWSSSRRRAAGTFGTTTTHAGTGPIRCVSQPTQCETLRSGEGGASLPPSIPRRPRSAGAVHVRVCAMACRRRADSDTPAAAARQAASSAGDGDPAGIGHRDAPGEGGRSPQLRAPAERGFRGVEGGAEPPLASLPSVLHWVGWLKHLSPHRRCGTRLSTLVRTEGVELEPARQPPATRP